MAGHMINPSTNFEDPVAIRSWVISSDISHRLLLIMRLQPLRMRRITWRMRRGKFYPHIWNPLTPICLFTTACPRKSAPKHNGVVFEILGNINDISTTECSTYLYIAYKNSWKFNVKIIIYYVFNYASKTPVFVTTRTHARSQLSPMKQCDHSSIVVTFFLTKNFN